MKILLFLLLTGVCLFAQDLQQARRWEYQLQDIDPFEIADSESDIAVIDYTRNGDPVFRFTQKEIRIMKHKAGGGKRLLLCYISIGEAEDYRQYWKRQWKRNPPSWIHSENPDWPGNYKVRYWDPEWKKLTYEYLDQILKMKFDGIYLDIVDGYEFFQDSIPDAKQRMIQWVGEISSYCKTRRSGKPFYVIGQNAEDLAHSPQYLSYIDGIAKEELFYGLDGPDKKNNPEEVDYSLQGLQKAKSAGKKIFLVEYLRDSIAIQDAQTQAEEQEFLFLNAHVELDRINTLVSLVPKNSHEDSSKINRTTPGQFYSLTAPVGTIRFINTLEYYTEYMEYNRPLNKDEDMVFHTPHFFELNNSISLSKGLSLPFRGKGHSIEAGFVIPIRYYEFSPDPVDSLWMTHEKTTGTGIGNVRLMASKGYSKNDFRDNLLFELVAEVPTDTRKGAVNPGVINYLGCTGEHYWNNFGLTAYAGLNCYGSSTYSNWWIVPEFRAGFGAQLIRRWFLSASAGYEAQSFRVEMSQEFLLSPFLSIDFSGGKELIGTSNGMYASVSLNKFFRVRKKKS